MVLTKGTKPKRGLLSTVHVRLAQFFTCLEGMDNTTVFDLFHNYDKLAVQPVRDTSQIDNIKNIQDLTDFYLTLEE
jgi:hypothetical protein